jgi:hypothetical protein
VEHHREWAERGGSPAAGSDGGMSRRVRMAPMSRKGALRLSKAMGPPSLHLKTRRRRGSCGGGRTERRLW